MAALTVGIAGFTGKFAKLLTSSLLEQDAKVKIKGLARDPAKADAAISSRSNVQVLQGDAFDLGKLRTFVRGCDVVVCCYLGDDHLMVEGQKILIDIAEEENVARYFASDWSLDWTKLQLGELFSKEPCQLIKAYLDTKQRIKGVHVLIGGFTEVVFAPFFRIWDVNGLVFRYWGTGNERWECTTYLNSAQYTAAAVLDRQAEGVLRFVGDVSSIREMAKTFEKVYGARPKLERQGSLDELHSTMLAERQKFGPDFYKYVFHWYHYFTLSGKALMGPNYDNNRYPNIKPFTIEEYMKDAEVESLGGANFLWENKTVRVVDVERSNGTRAG